MILDSLLQFSNNQAITATANSTNIIDIGLGLQPTANPNGNAIPSPAQGGGARDLGIGNSDAGLRMIVQVGTVFATLTSLTVALQGAVDDGTGAPAAFSTYWTGPAVAVASLVAGARLFDMDVPRPPQGIAVPRFLQLVYTVGGSNATTGTITAYVVGNRDDQMYNGTNNAVIGGYRAGITVAN